MFTRFLKPLGHLVRGIVTRTLVLLAAATFGALWADGLLQAGRRATEMVMTTSDLRQLAAAEAAPGETVTGPVEAGAGDEPDEQRGRDDEQESAVADPASAGHTSRTPADDDAPPADDEPCAAPPPEASGTVPEFGGEGSLQSFMGQAAASADGGAQTGIPGSGPAWMIRFDQVYSADRLIAVPRTRLAAVRQRLGGAECVLIAGRQFGVTQSLAALLDAHPEFSHRRGILLPRSWFREFDDRLLARGGGWQFWLLVEDALFAEWIEQVAAELADRQLTWDQLRRIEARLALSRTRGWRLEVTGIEEEVAAEGSARALDGARGQMQWAD